MTSPVAKPSSGITRRLRNGAVLLAVFVALYALLGFLLLPVLLKLTADGIKDGGPPTRVDFAIR